MKCGQLNSGDLAQAYRNAAQDAGNAAVDMTALAPHLKATGSSCVACPALLALAKKAFDAEESYSQSRATMGVPDVNLVLPERS